MVALPTSLDPTLAAVDRAIEARENARPPRAYLGMSAIGRSCRRQLWYLFRWALPVSFPASAHRRFEDGHRGEDIQADRLRLVQGITLLTVDPDTGRQFGFSDHDDHFRGHMDGVVLGLLQAPKTWHVWEHKQTAEDKQAKLEKLKREAGEKSALAAWDTVYYAQAILYMDYAGLTRHYLTCASPGGRRTVSVRTDADPVEAQRLRAKAETIIRSPAPLERISDNPSYYECRFCDFAQLCHSDMAAPRHCRTCVFATPAAAGLWRCHRHHEDRDTGQQQKGCADHRYVPGLVPGEQVDAAADGSWISYRMPDGSAWIDGAAP